MYGIFILPGADITDYFNYGFNEDTWKVYCEKQKKLRAENGTSYEYRVTYTRLSVSVHKLLFSIYLFTPFIDLLFTV